VAPGTALREGIDMILSARTGALIVIGDEENVSELSNGGFAFETPYTPQRLYELAKMDGAIILDSEGQRILKANVHLVPDSTLPTVETGMRHRAAERVSLQTKAIVIAISQRRNTISLYLMGNRFTLEDTEKVLAKANQALQTLQRYRTALDDALTRLTTLEFDDVVTVGDVSETVSRFEAVRRVGREVERLIGQLGTEGRLVRMQAEELRAGVTHEYLQLLRDYAADPSPRAVATLTSELGEMPLDKLLETDVMSAKLGLNAAQKADEHMRARGFRILAQIPMIPSGVVSRIIDRYVSLPEILRATAEDLDDIDGIGTRRAKAIINGLNRARMQTGA
jgi:diadenylate cyclase